MNRQRLRNIAQLGVKDLDGDPAVVLEVFGQREQYGGCKGRCHGLSRFHAAGQNNPVDRGSNHGFG